MSEHENELKKALSENTGFDPEKGKELVTHAVSQFRAAQKKAERLLWFFLLVCLCLGVFAGYRLLFAASVKAVVGFGILLLIAYETTVLMKLWYWTVNVKLTLLKEMKLWYAQSAVGRPTTQLMSPTADVAIHRSGLTRWERAAWMVLGATVASVIGAYLSHQFASTSTLTLRDHVILNASGTASSAMNVSYQPKRFSTSSFPFYSGSPGGTIHWLDDRSRELPYDVSIENGQRHYMVHLIEPLTIGEWLRYSQISENPRAATRQGDLWTYVNNFTYGGHINQYYVTLELPRGATLVSADPPPVEQTTIEETTRVTFQAIRSMNEQFGYKIQYRVADKAPDQPKPKP